MYTRDQIELVDSTLDELTIELIAVACHQQNRTYCELNGDDSQVNWEKAPEWQTNSAVSGVRAALVNPDPAASHKSWLEQKAKEGWVYGEEKNVFNKTHPCMVPYSDLPEVQKRKDHLFIEMVQQIGLAAGLIRVKG